MGLSKSPLPFRLLVVTNRSQFDCPDRWAEQIMRITVGVPPKLLGIWIREKDLDGQSLWHGCKQVGQELTGRGITTILSSRADIAQASGFWGVHTGWDAPPAARIIHSFPTLAVGSSCHDPHLETEIQAATTVGCRYVVVSPIFSTVKPYRTVPLGLRGLERARHVTSGPIIALGGVNTTNVGVTLRAGADAVACLGAIWCNRDPGSAVLHLLDATSR